MTRIHSRLCRGIALLWSVRAVSAQSPQSAQVALRPPFAFADFTWLNGNARTTDTPLDSKAFTGEFRLDVNYVADFNHPRDHTLVGSSELGRTAEVQVQQLGVGGDFHVGQVQGRVMTQFGMYSTMTPRNDASPGRGQWNLDQAYRYISEAYAGRHFDVLNGVNLQAGIFMSYVGLFSYYNFDNWAYQPSYVSSNTPWFFNGVRLQIFPSEKLKIEPWLVNGFQAYGMFNEAPGLGLQVLYRPNGNWSLLSNSYAGADVLNVPGRQRLHSDNSVEVKFLDAPPQFVDKGAMSLTFDLGCEHGGGVACYGGTASRPSQNFLGFMLYDRTWLAHDRFAVTLGGGAMSNPGRYLVLVPPINGATAFTGSPYFSTAPGDSFNAWDASATLDYMPDQFTTFRVEINHRAANVPYFTGAGGVTPAGGNNGRPDLAVPGFTPDLRNQETRMTFAMLLKL